MTETKTMNEHDLVVEFRKAKERHAQLKQETTKAQLEIYELERKLVDLLQAQEKTASARYEGVGFVSLMSPTVYANYEEENSTALFEFLRKLDRDDLIKNTVNAKSLSSFVKQLLDDGKEIPGCIKYYLKTGLRLTKT